MKNISDLLTPKNPIIFIHTGNSWYLPYTIYQLKKTNPNTPIYLIGDHKNKQFHKWTNHIDAANFTHLTSTLKNVYIHKSTLGEEFEFNCIARWFILLEFMNLNNIDKCIYLDSDILVYKDLSKVEKNFSKYDMTWCGFSAHTNFITNRKALENYCKNVIDCYSNKFPNELRNKSLYHQVISGKTNMNISDMTFFHDYNLRYPNSLLDISLPNEKGTFDRSIEDTRVFEGDQNDFKKIYWQKKKPYCKEIASQKLIPFVTLHFQGKGKKILKFYFSKRTIPFYIFNAKNYSKIVMNKLLK